MEQDIKYIRENAMELSNNILAMKKFERLVQNHRRDIENLTKPTFENWQKLVYSNKDRNEFENILSDILLRYKLQRNTICFNKYIDQLILEVIQRSKISESYYPFVSVCGGGLYSNTAPMNVICSRISDIYRIWNLGIIGHEVGHDVLKQYFKPTPVLNYAPFTVSGEVDINQVVNNWMIELASDIIGTLTLGPSVLEAHMNMPTLWTFFPQSEQNFIANFLTHPPCEIRFHIHNLVLKTLNISPISINLDFLTLADHVDQSHIEHEDHILLQDRKEDIELLLPRVIMWYKNIFPYLLKNIEYFNKKDWKKSLQFAEYLKNGEKKDDSFKPSHILNGCLKVKPEEINPDIEHEMMSNFFSLIDCL